MEIQATHLSGVYKINNHAFHDRRGSLVKTFHWDTFRQHGLKTDFKECFYSISYKDILRGMHYQAHPHDHEKLVHVVEGCILDVVVDIEHESPTFGMHYATRLSSDNAHSLYIGKGYAHGFLTLSEKAIVMYMTSSTHSPEHDKGIHWDSFDFNWKIDSPIMSDRDSSLPPLKKPAF